MIRPVRRWPAAARALLGALVLAVALAAGPGAPARAQSYEILDGIKGKDDRLQMPSAEYPWSAIGRVNTETGGHCSGVLVAPSVVVTAAHCLFDTRKVWFVPPKQVHFVAGFEDGAYIAHSIARSYYVPKQYREGEPPTGDIAQHDWAFIVLRNAVGARTGWFGVTGFGRDAFPALRQAGTVFVQAGYSRDRDRVLTVHVACPVEGFAKGLALAVHQCDAVPGDSGSPIFYFEDGLPVLAGVHVATTRRQQPVRGVAVPTATFREGVMQMGGGAPTTPALRPLIPFGTVERLLTALGYDPASGLEAAVRDYETRQGLEPMGELSYSLVGHLIGGFRTP